MVTISRGNIKLGKIFNFSLPCKDTCPGKTTLCEEICYVDGFHRSAREAYQRNYEASLLSTFHAEVIAKLRRVRSRDKVFRIHVSGDFYTQVYIQKWILIARALPDWKFFGYTRSWRVPEFLPHLERLRSLPNVVLYASTDSPQEEGQPGWLVAQLFEDNPSVLRCKEEIFNDLIKQRYNVQSREDIERIAEENELRSIKCDTCRWCIDGRGNIAFKVR